MDKARSVRKTFGSFFPSQGPPSCDHASPTLSPRETKTCPRTQRARVFVTALFPLAKNRKPPVAVHKGAGAGTVTNSQDGHDSATEKKFLTEAPRASSGQRVEGQAGRRGARAVPRVTF